MKKNKKRMLSSRQIFLTGILMGLALLGLTGCGPGLPDGVKKEAESLVKGMDTTQKHIQDQKKKFNGLASSKEFTPLASYAKKENWGQAFDQANTTLSRARDLYDTQLSPIIKKNEPQGEAQARAQIQRINKVIQEARQQAAAPFARMDRIRAAMTDTKAITARAKAEGKRILSQVQTLEAGPVGEAREKFPDSVSKIDARFARFSKMETETRNHLETIEKEYQAHASSGQPDYAAFITSADAIARDKKALATEGPELEKSLALLYQSYTKVLQDMKVDYFVTIKRESWDERSDYYDPRFATFQRQVTPAVYQALAETELDSIADLAPGYGGLSLKNHIGSTWQGLGLNPTDNWPDRRHNAASFWVEGTKEAYYHKYLQETNGETKETGWTKVNPSFFAQNLDNLGMAILSKPYGEFEPDSHAAPPGMAYVGNSQYGEWKKDENGESFWSWYGRYAFFSSLFFFPPSYYHYGAWNRWNTGYRYKKPYYGKTKSGAYTYGTRGTKIKRSPRYQNTNFAKTGGFKSGIASVRGAGAGLRGGGPKGKGK